MKKLSKNKIYNILSFFKFFLYLKRYPKLKLDASPNKIFCFFYFFIKLYFFDLKRYPRLKLDASPNTITPATIQKVMEENDDEEDGDEENDDKFLNEAM